MKNKLFALVLLATLLLTSCVPGFNGNGGNQPGGGNLPSDDSSYGEGLEDLGALDGIFEGDLCDVEVKHISGTKGAYTLADNVLTFSGITQDSAYSVSGKISGRIVINVGEGYKFELQLNGISIISGSDSAITVLGGNKVTVQANKGSQNYIYDTRAAIGEDDAVAHSGAIHSEVDLELSGKGSLSVVSENNNGIHSKDDLYVKNLALTVSCKDNALKGNDSIVLEDATATLIATKGDCIKTVRSDISEKGNQRGSVYVNGGRYDIYAACDGIDAAYDLTIDGSSTEINIYTDKYSNYSEEITAVSEDNYYIRFNYNSYKYSIKYYNSDDDYLWVNAEHHSTVSGGRNSYYYYSFPKNEDYSKLQFFVYSATMEQGQDTEYLVASDLITPDTSYDTIALTLRNNYLYYDWTNYSTTVTQSGPGGPGFPGGGGPGGFGEGNSDKGDYSTKGVKADNEITINAGKIIIKSYDDAIHANGDATLENGKSPLGNLTVNGGSLTLYSNDDGLHADNALVINGGSVNIINSYEGMEGTTVAILGGDVSVIAKDDGINGTATSGAAITVGGGTLYIYCGGDGIDSNSRTSYGGILFSGGKTLVISTSGGNSAIDSEAGYSYTGGSVVAVMPSGGMSSEAKKCDKISTMGKSTSLSLNQGNYLSCNIGNDSLTVKMPVSLNALVIALGSTSISISSGTTDTNGLSDGEFIWK